ncbi:hypothetical protein Tco_0969779 [Tanacetum coccineum]
MLVACHIFTYTLKDSAKIRWNSQKAGSILDYEDLKAKFRSHFSQQKKFTKTHLAAHNIKLRENERTRAFITRYTDDTLHILGLQEDQRISSFIHGLRTKSLVEHLSTDLPPTYKGLMEKTYTWVEEREVATNGVSNDRKDSFEGPRKSSWNNNKGQMDRSRSFPYKGERDKEKRKTSDTSCQRKEERRKASIGENLYPYGKRKRPQAEEETYERQWDGRNHVPPISNEGSSDPVVIKIKPTQISSSGRPNTTPQWAFFMRKSHGLRRSPFGKTQNGEGPLTITKTLTFVIVRSDSSHNLLLGRRAMQEMGIVVSIVHGYIKFHTPNGVGTIFSEHNSQRLMEEEGNLTNNGQGDAKHIFSCIDTKENIVIDDEYPKQKVTIGRQLPTRIKMRLRDLLRAHADVFAWTTTHITGVMRTLIIKEETFSTEHQLNVFNHTKPVKQKKRSLAPKRNEVVRTQVEELVEAGVLQEVKYQT